MVRITGATQLTNLTYQRNEKRMTGFVTETIAFGPFTLNIDERLLLRSGEPTELGARAFDILANLAARPKEVVGKKELLDLVWPDVTVEESSLRFHIANLRKALGDGVDGARYIATLSGRGYCFVAPVSTTTARNEIAVSYPQADLPARPVRMVGREKDCEAIAALLLAKRFVTIVGTGGVGKTTVAVAVGHNELENFRGAVHFVDLGALRDPGLVAPTIASMLGLSPQSHDAGASVIAYLANRQVLLILDTCEHVVEAAADLATRIFVAAPGVHILATSREPLLVGDEQIHKLAPLQYPPDDLEPTMAAVKEFPAIRLFLDRAEAGGARLDYDDVKAAILTDICRKLDGLPLAIELAAGRVATHGLQQTARLLEERLSLLWPGLRTAPTRQRTLHATLEWSFGLLSEIERTVIRRLAIFVGQFSIEAALTVVTSPSVHEALVFSVMDGLVAKSIVAAQPCGASMRYRLLDTTRAYAKTLEIDDAELAELAARHAKYCLRWLQEVGEEPSTALSAARRSLRLSGLANTREALDWCFGPLGDARLGISLAVASAPIFLSMSLLAECHRRMEQALLLLTQHERGGLDEMHLQSTLGVSLMFTRGGQHAAGAALERSLSISDQVGSALDQLQILGPLQMFHVRTGDFRKALGYAERCHSIAKMLGDPASATLAHSLMGISLHLRGDLDRARATLETALQYGLLPDRSTTNYLGFDGRILAGAILARTLWLEGHSDRAVERVLLTVKEAERHHHPLTLSISLVWAVSLFLWLGDLDQADAYVERLLSRAECHALGPYLAVARGFRGELAIRRGDPEQGIDELKSSLGELHAAPYELLSTPLNIALVEGFIATTQLPEALALIEDTIRSIEVNGDLCYQPEALRIKANVLAEMSRDAEEVRQYLARSINLSKAQGARAWQQRAEIDLANRVRTLS